MPPRILDDQERARGLGGTDVAAIMGVSPYRKPIDVYQEKRGEGQPFQQTWAMRLGQIFEDAIAGAYAEQRGVRLARMGVAFHKQHPFLYVHPDRRVVGEPGLVECKKSRTHRSDGSGLRPDWSVQAAWQMALTGRLWVDVVAFDGYDIDPIRVERDQALIDDLTEAAVQFWHDHIEAGVPPEPDGSDAYGAYLKAKYPTVTDDELTATATQALLVEEYRSLQTLAKNTEASMERIKQTLGDQMKDAAVLIAPGGKVRRTLPKPSVQWKPIAAGLAERHGEDLDALAAAAVDGAVPKPSIRVYPKKEDQ
jgi:putative phage-type endonuclease